LHYLNLSKNGGMGTLDFCCASGQRAMRLMEWQTNARLGVADLTQPDSGCIGVEDL